MSNTQTFERDFGFLFEATAEGLDLQRQIVDSNGLAQTAMAGAQKGFKGIAEAEVPVELATAAADAFSLSAITERLTEELSEKERVVSERLAGTALSVRVLGGESKRKMRSTHFSGGMVGARSQEFGVFLRNHRNGTFRAAFLGQNVLVLYPQRMSGQQLDECNIMVPILRENGEPNIQLMQREPTWRDGMSRIRARAYEGAASLDIPRLRTLATQL